MRYKPESLKTTRPTKIFLVITWCQNMSHMNSMSVLHGYLGHKQRSMIIASVWRLNICYCSREYDFFFNCLYMCHFTRTFVNTFFLKSSETGWFRIRWQKRLFHNLQMKFWDYFSLHYELNGHSYLIRLL